MKQHSNAPSTKSPTSLQAALVEVAEKHGWAPTLRVAFLLAVCGLTRVPALLLLIGLLF